jgi:hypothetical protein
MRLTHRRSILTIGLLTLPLLIISQQSSATELLVNGNFENVLYKANDYSLVAANTPIAGMVNVTTTGGLRNSTATIPGWGTTVYSTTALVPIIEVWNGSFNSPSQGPGAYNGVQYAEMNSYAAGSLVQSIANGAPGDQLYLSFAHSDRGGDSVSSQMRVTLFDLGANGTFDSVLATPGSPNPTLGGDDAFLMNYLITAGAYNSALSPLKNNWTQYEISATATTTNNMVLAFQAVVNGSTGNFLDSVSLNTTSIGGTSVLPEPSTLTLASLGIGALLTKRRKH